MVVKWVETVKASHLSRVQYVQKRFAGIERSEILNHYYGGDPRIFRQQLLEWELLSLEDEQKELKRLARLEKREITITKDEYLKRLLAGETRTQIIKSLGGSPNRVYKLLETWGIKELDAEERELELLSPAKLATEVDKRVAEQLEQKAEARGLLEYNQRTQSDEPVPAEEQNQELANLQAAVALWKHSAESEREHRLRIEGELGELRKKYEQDNATAARIVEQEVELTKQKDAEIKRLNDALEGAAIISNLADQQIKELKSERQLLLRTIEHSADDGDLSCVTIQIPIMSVAFANLERSRIYDAVEALSNGFEAADIDRGRVMSELFDLLQRTVNFITADLAELHPGRDVSRFVREFFGYYNGRHLAQLDLPDEAPDRSGDDDVRQAS